MAEHYEGKREENSRGRENNGDKGRPYADRPPTNDRQPARPYSDRPARSNERPSYGDRDNRGGQGGRPSGDRDNRGADRPIVNGRREDRKPFGDRDNRGGQGGRPSGDRPSYGDRPARSNDRPSYGDRDNRGGQGGRPSGDRPSYGDRPARSNDRPSYGDRDSRPSQGAREDRGPRTAPERNAADLRSSNRPDRERSPEIDPDVTGEELDKVTRAQLRILDAKNNEWVSKHLVMAGRLIDFVPELAFEHALAASRRGGRLACVREAVAMTAYAAGKYGEALRELRTFRRISGSNAHLPLMADCERGLGRPDRALDLIKSEDAETLDLAGKVELAIVESGARGDLGEMEAALSALEIPQLDINRAFSFSPRLFRAYGMVLRAAGRKDEAKTWERQALVAEEALGIDEGTDQIIIDLGDDEDIPLDSPRVRVADVMAAPVAPVMNDADTLAAAELTSEDADVQAQGEKNVDDAESSYFESDDAESDADSVDADAADLENGAEQDSSEESSTAEGEDFDELNHRES